MKATEAYFVSAGEHSGDLLAADLVLALKDALPRYRAFGIVGDALERAGVQPLAHTDELGMMGIMDVAKRLGDLRMLEKRLLQQIERQAPRFAVLVDFPGFHLRLAEQLRLRGIKVFQYIAPKLWAWGAGRVTKVKDGIDLVLGILPFEESFYRAQGINYVYVGSPLRDRTDKVLVERGALGLANDETIIACLPGSRISELRRIMPRMRDVARHIRSAIGDATFVVPLAPSLSREALLQAFPGLEESKLSALFHPEGVGFTGIDYQGLRLVRGMSLEIMALADAALVGSGTATLECALLGTPMVVMYDMDPLSYKIAKRLVHIQHVSLPNLVAGEAIVREFIQDYTAEAVAQEVISLIKDATKRASVKTALNGVRAQLKGQAARTAASTIVDFLSAHSRTTPT